MNYVIGDIHGCYDDFMYMIKTIELQDEDARYLLVGDFVDRGPQVIEMIEWAKKNIKPGGKFQSVLGNHEKMLIDWHNEYKKRRISGDKYYPSTVFGFEILLKKKGLANELYVLPVIKFFETLPLYIEIYVENKCYIICHAGLPGWKRFQKIKKTGRLNEDDISVFLWERDITSYDNEDITVIHGHTPTLCYNEKNIIYQNNTINVDCGCVFKNSNGRLAAFCIESKKEFYI